MLRTWLRQIFVRSTGRSRSNSGRLRNPARLGLWRLEDRVTPAFNTIVNTLPTPGMPAATAAGTTTFTAIASGATADISDVAMEFGAGNNVIIDSGSTGTEAGNIDVTTALIGTGNTLTLRTGSGANLVGDITLNGFGLS